MSIILKGFAGGGLQLIPVKGFSKGAFIPAGDIICEFEETDPGRTFARSALENTIVDRPGIMKFTEVKPCQ